MGECLWLEMNDDTLSKHKLHLIVKIIYFCLEIPLIVKIIYYCLENSDKNVFLEQRSIFILLRLVIDHEICLL